MSKYKRYKKDKTIEQKVLTKYGLGGLIDKAKNLGEDYGQFLLNRVPGVDTGYESKTKLFETAENINSKIDPVKDVISGAALAGTGAGQLTSQATNITSQINPQEQLEQNQYIQGNSPVRTMRCGGKMKRYQGGGELTEFNGYKHEQGGIPIGNSAEVEDGETKMDNFIYSDNIMYDKKSTFADQSKKINKKYSLRPNDKYSTEAKQMELKELANQQESLKTSNGEVFDEFKQGGKLNFKSSSAYNKWIDDSNPTKQNNYEMGGRIKYENGGFIEWAGKAGYTTYDIAAINAYKQYLSDTYSNTGNYGKYISQFKSNSAKWKLGASIADITGKSSNTTGNAPQTIDEAIKRNASEGKPADYNDNPNKYQVINPDGGGTIYYNTSTGKAVAYTPPEYKKFDKTDNDAGYGYGEMEQYVFNRLNKNPNDDSIWGLGTKENVEKAYDKWASSQQQPESNLEETIYYENNEAQKEPVKEPVKESMDYSYESPEVNPLTPDYFGMAASTLPGIASGLGNLYIGNQIDYDRVAPEQIRLQQLDPTSAVREVSDLVNTNNENIRQNARGIGSYLSNRLASQSAGQRGTSAVYADYDNKNVGIANQQQQINFNERTRVRDLNAGIQRQEQQDKLGYKAAALSGFSNAIGDGVKYRQQDIRDRMMIPLMSENYDLSQTGNTLFGGRSVEKVFTGQGNPNNQVNVNIGNTPVNWTPDSNIQTINNGTLGEWNPNISQDMYDNIQFGDESVPLNHSLLKKYKANPTSSYMDNPNLPQGYRYGGRLKKKDGGDYPPEGEIDYSNQTYTSSYTPATAQQNIKIDKFNTLTDADNLSEMDFRDKYNISSHRVKMENDPVYRNAVLASSKELAKKYGSIDYPSTDVRNKDFVNPYLSFMSPQQTNPELARGVQDYNLGLIGLAAPIPGLGAGKATKYLKGLPNAVSPKVAAVSRAERLVAQSGKFADDVVSSTSKSRLNDVAKGKRFEEGISSAYGHTPVELGVNKGGEKAVLFTDAINKKTGKSLTDVEKQLVSSHETGHFYKNTPKEAKEWLGAMDLSNTKTGKYLRGKPIRSKGLPGETLSPGHAEEIRERAGQLKDFVAMKKGIPLAEDFTMTMKDLNYAISNYTKEVRLDNNMIEFIKAIKSKKNLLKTINKYALGTTVVASGANLKE